VSVKKQDGASCDPGSVCVENASCRGGECLGDTRQCDDHNGCTADLCVWGLGCVHPARPDGSLCSVGDMCTDGDACVDGKCVGIPDNCDDGRACTTDVCVAGLGCVHPPVVCPVSSNGLAAVCDEDSGKCCPLSRTQGFSHREEYPWWVVGMLGTIGGTFLTLAAGVFVSYVAL